MSQSSPTPNPSETAQAVALRASRRRDKPQLSCNLCRRRKLKCDRGQPCATCAHRGLSLSCTYVQPNTATPRERVHASTSMQDRIGQLETLVMSLKSTLNATKSISQVSGKAHALSTSVTTDHSEVENLSQNSPEILDSFGRISLENSETSYVENAHWTSILDGISELKDYFEDDYRPVERLAPMPEFDKPDLPFGPYKNANKQEILMALPARPIVDRLVARYFNAMDVAPGVLHSPTFFRQYEKFWENPIDTPVMWISILYSIICLATLDQQLSSNESSQPSYQQSTSDNKRLIQTYREKVIQCIVLGKYTKCVPYTIESLSLYMHIEYLRTQDAQIEIWILLGIMIRVALRMGYHRDGSHFPRLSPFEAEMRRRNWAVIILYDRVASAQVGLPAMIQASQSDTLEPRNLLDQDFDEDTLSLPPSRPSTEHTAMQFLVVKNKPISVFGRITDLTSSTDPSSHVEVMKLDKLLHATYAAIPHGLHMRPLSKSLIDSPLIIIKRILLILTFHKAQCTLHRKYLLAARINSAYAYSRTTCIEAALQMLQYQAILHQETQPDGMFYRDRWKMSSLIKQEFLLATTILCLVLDQDITAETSQRSNEAQDTEIRERVIQALNGCYQIWLESSATSREARKVAEVLRILLGKVQRTRARNTAACMTNTPSTSSGSNSFTANILEGTLNNSTPWTEQRDSISQLPDASLSPFFDVSSWMEPDAEGRFDQFNEMTPDPFDMVSWDVDYHIPQVDGDLDLFKNYSEPAEFSM